jgi:hypothetical protein
MKLFTATKLGRARLFEMRIFVRPPISRLICAGSVHPQVLGYPNIAVTSLYLAVCRHEYIEDALSPSLPLQFVVSTGSLVNEIQSFAMSLFKATSLRYVLLVTALTPDLHQLETPLRTKLFRWHLGPAQIVYGCMISEIHRNPINEIHHSFIRYTVRTISNSLE